LNAYWYEALQAEEITSAHRFCLTEIMAHIEELESRMARFDAELLRSLGVAGYATPLRLLQTLPGIDLMGAAMLLVEIGSDMSVFGSAQRLASWVGMCPGNNESAGKRKSGRIRKGNLSGQRHRRRHARSNSSHPIPQHLRYSLGIAIHTMHITTKLLSLVTLVLACASPTSAADPSPEAMFKRLTALTESGNADVKYNLGMFLNNGIGTQRDNKAAFRYFSEAAEAGNVLASYKVGCYYAGQFTDVVPSDEQTALKFKLPAAEAGYDLAQHDVAMHFGKIGDIANALKWWEKASRQAYMPSTAYLANYVSRSDSKDKAKGFALMLILKEQMPNTPKELSDRLAAAQAELSDVEKKEAANIRTSWLTGPTPLTTAARAGTLSTEYPELLVATMYSD